MTRTGTRVYRNRDAEQWGATAPHTTLVLACYRVERYLPVFLASLDAQTADHDGYELIFVIDGCPEDSERVVREWAARTDFPVCVVTQENQGVAAARNAGLELARGAWVSSPDPDDRLDPGYLREIERARARFAGETMFVGRIRLFSPAGDETRHPLSYKYGDGSVRLVDLTESPDDIQTLGGTVFFATEHIRANALRMRPELVTESDADFIMQFLIATAPRYVLVPTAEYFYQRRVDASSIVKTNESNIERFRVVFGVTHRDLLVAAGPECPQWLANTLLYFVTYLFRRNLQLDSPVYRTDPAVLSEIRAELIFNLRLIGQDRIRSFRVFDVPIEMRMAWLAQTGGLSSSPVEWLGAEPNGAIQRVCYYVDVDHPAPAVDPGQLPGIVEIKTRGVEFLGWHWVEQRIFRVSGGAEEALRLASPGPDYLELGGVAYRAATIRQKLGQARPSFPQPTAAPRRGPAREFAARVRRRAQRLRFSLPLRLAGITGYARRYAGAVVLAAGDSEDGASDAWRAMRDAVHSSASGVNAWRVLRPGEHRGARTPRKSVVRSGSIAHFLLLKQADAVLTPHLTAAAVAPFPGRILAKTWRLVHVPIAPPVPRGYRKLNSAAIDLVLAASVEELELLAGDGGDYRFTRSEVVLCPDYREQPSQVWGAGLRAALTQGNSASPR
ncbi:glycosyltransferase family 2 protein [Leucobacter luti]|uniref:Glycosyltransferase involved in cell wall biosynthesis n=1 Tax=Leucobacter luti TaxID=340320 RepID=A0A4Q7TSQ0_9MICO|nr:glycosyltransferase [Leucobacter luti]MBL3699738.1 glycosyltransferase [Leucobacter luti]RZT62940.1 glycosyltransferase involved in cell wall biosynthesis [Leucobacter luti]